MMTEEKIKEENMRTIRLLSLMEQIRFRIGMSDNLLTYNELRAWIRLSFNENAISTIESALARQFSYIRTHRNEGGFTKYNSTLATYDIYLNFDNITDKTIFEHL